LADRIAIRADTLFDGISGQPQHNRAVLIEGGRIADIVDGVRVRDFCDEVLEARIATPGFIDLQLNGAGGVLFNDHPEPEALETIAAAARRGGTAYFLPTFITDERRKYQRAMQAVETAQTLGVIGLHLEGPFLSPDRPGIHPAEHIRQLDPSDMQDFSEFSAPLLLTLAPEEATPGQISDLADAGVKLFVGHSQASFEVIETAEKQGLCGATHLFNAMSQINPRDPGVVGAVLASNRLFAGIIADGIHVHRANLQLAFECLGPNRLFLVSDAMSPLGTELATFELLGKHIYRRDGRLTDADGVLAGADLPMIKAVVQMVKFTGCGLGQAIRMASLTSARAVGLDAELGSLSPGKRAGVTLLDGKLNVVGVVVDGVLA
jgi:N-acetylglucosamine-6-phosphate deacetylase